MKSFQALVLALIAATVSGAAFVVPAASKQGAQTALAFGFLKDLGLEKPSWLPDFGKKEEKPAGEEPSAEAGEEEETEAAPAE